MQHILTIPDLTDDFIKRLFTQTDALLKTMDQPDKQLGSLRGRTLINLFFENSTRTLVSFEIAGKRLGMDVVNFDVEASSLKKDESITDTLLTLDAMAADVMVIRSKLEGVPMQASKMLKASIINGGDGVDNHPTQALFDAYTILKEKGRIEGLTVAICGDIKHSRVAASNMQLLKRLGAKIRLVCPENLQPTNIPDGIKLETALQAGIEGADVVMMLRIQKERLGVGESVQDHDYAQSWCLTHEILAAAKPGAIVMHPGPMNRGIEICSKLADDPQRSVILKQVRNAVGLRMACLQAVTVGL